MDLVTGGVTSVDRTRRISHISTDSRYVYYSSTARIWERWMIVAGPIGLLIVILLILLLLGYL